MKQSTKIVGATGAITAGAAAGALLLSNVAVRAASGLENALATIDDPALGAGIGATVVASGLLPGKKAILAPLGGAVLASVSKFYHYGAHMISGLDFSEQMITRCLLPIAIAGAIGYGIGEVIRYTTKP